MAKKQTYSVPYSGSKKRGRASTYNGSEEAHDPHRASIRSYQMAKTGRTVDKL